MRANQEVVQSLVKTAHAHHDKFGNFLNKEDENWALWYAKYLLEQTEFQAHTTRVWTEDDLSQALIYLESAFSATQPNQTWSVYYASRLDS